MSHREYKKDNFHFFRHFKKKKRAMKIREKKKEKDRKKYLYYAYITRRHQLEDATASK